MVQVKVRLEQSRSSQTIKECAEMRESYASNWNFVFVFCFYSAVSLKRQATLGWGVWVRFYPIVSVKNSKQNSHIAATLKRGKTEGQTEMSQKQAGLQQKKKAESQKSTKPSLLPLFSIKKSHKK